MIEHIFDNIYGYYQTTGSGSKMTTRYNSDQTIVEFDSIIVILGHPPISGLSLTTDEKYTSIKDVKVECIDIRVQNSAPIQNVYNHRNMNI